MKLAVFFPGVGYTNDMPLLYYSRKIASNLGYDFIKLNYKDLGPEMLSDEEKIKKGLVLSYRAIERRLREVDLSKYDRIVFISKSIGTVIAAKYDERNSMEAEHIYFTPVEQTFESITQKDPIVFYSNGDPFTESSFIEEKCSDLGYKMYMIDQGNHSLETQDTLEDIDRMKFIMTVVKNYLKKEISE